MRPPLEGLLSRLPRLLEYSWSVRLRFALARRPLPRSRLTTRERSILDGFPSPVRRASWLTGRAALRKFCRDTAGLRFPHPGLSLTHSNTVAVAVAGEGLAGLGIDLEIRRAPPARGARFFLTPRERRHCDPLTPETLRRLWTIKEACFKADPENASSALRRFELSDPTASRGSVRGRPGLLYRAFPFRDGCLAVGILIAASPQPKPVATRRL